MKLFPIIAAALALASCRDQAPPAPTADQANRLDDAENMLNGVAAADEKGPEQRPGPSHVVRR